MVHLSTFLTVSCLIAATAAAAAHDTPRYLRTGAAENTEAIHYWGVPTKEPVEEALNASSNENEEAIHYWGVPTKEPAQ